MRTTKVHTMQAPIYTQTLATAAPRRATTDRPMPFLPPIATAAGREALWAGKPPARLPMPPREEVRGFVKSFYGEVLLDEQLGSIFQRVVGASDEEWGTHYETLTDFWLAVVFDGPAFRGNPMVKHAAVKDIAAEHFERWLQIFERVARDYWPHQVAALFELRARQISVGLIAGITRAREKQLVTQFR
jgi:hemoglobin